MHSAPGISAAGGTFFGRVHPMCAHFFTQFSLQYTRGVHRKIPRRTVSICVHPRGAHNNAMEIHGVALDVKVHFQVLLRKISFEPLTNEQL